jgi:hypothetical protein
MPNIPPHGLFARHNKTWKGANAIYARDAGVWKPAIAVYAMKNGVWELIWAASATSPTGVAITYTQGQVNVAITPSTPAIADSYNIYRPDGSLAGTIPYGPSPSFVDANPRPLTGSYTVFGVLNGAQAPAGTTSNSLDLTLQARNLAGVLVGSDVQLTWDPALAGSPDSWNVYRVVGGVPQLIVSNLIVTTYTDTNAAPGADHIYIVQPILSGIAGTTATINVQSPIGVPTSVTLVASGTSNLRLSWGAPSAGTPTGYEVETSTDGSTWAPHADNVSPSDWATTTSTGYMRVRALSSGGSSAWVTLGPVAAINDITPPPNATLTSWKPESSYGRMVVRFTTPSAAAAPDLNSYLVQQRLAGGAWANVGSWTAAANATTYAVVCTTRSAGQVAEVRVLLRDDNMNENSGVTGSYTLAATPTRIDPSGDKSGTWRNTAWRNDSSRSTTEIATGWTSSGHNVGCFFYGTTIAASVGGKTVVSATIEYYRENEGGLGAAVTPLFWTHALTGRTAAPVPDALGVAEASRTGQGLIRSTPNAVGSFTLPSAFITALQAGTRRGLCMYRGYQGSGDPDNYYGLFGIGAVSNNGKVNGRLTFNHLG